MIDIKTLYDSRFTHKERVQKNQLWEVLCKDFLQQFIGKSDTVVDVGAGQCEFINNIHCKKKIAIDINPDVKKIAKKDVQVIIAPVKKLHDALKETKVNIIFMSNLLEHLDSKEDVFRLLLEAHKSLQKNGKLLIMQPDIALVGNAYWDFFDHKVPITYASLLEALYSLGFTISYSIYPFLPYSTKAKFLPLWPSLLKAYLFCRPLHFIFGKQFFVCAQKG